MKISFEIIHRLGACWEPEEWKANFGDATEVEITPQNGEKYARQVNWYWLASNLFPRKGHEKYIDMVDKAESVYYSARQGVRERIPYPEGVPYRDRRQGEIYEARQAEYAKISLDFENAVVQAFFTVYNEHREYADKTIEFHSSDSEEVGPNGERQYRTEYPEEGTLGY